VRNTSSSQQLADETVMQHVTIQTLHQMPERSAYWLIRKFEFIATSKLLFNVTAH